MWGLYQYYFIGKETNIEEKYFFFSQSIANFIKIAVKIDLFFLKMGTKTPFFKTFHRSNSIHSPQSSDRQLKELLLK